MRELFFVSSAINGLNISNWRSLNGHDFELDFLDNRLTVTMNDLHSIDFAKRDWLEDIDYVVARVT